MKSRWWYASDSFPQNGYSQLASTTRAGSQDWTFKNAQKLTIEVLGAFVRDDLDGFGAGDNDVIVATKHRVGNRPILDKIHFFKQEVPEGQYEGAFFHPVVYATNDFSEAEFDEITLEVRVFDEDSLSEEAAKAIEAAIGAASQAAAVAFPVFAPFAGLAAGAGNALVRLVDRLNDHDRILEGRIRLAANMPEGQGWDLLQPGFLVCFAEEVDASSLLLGQDRRVYGKQGNAYPDFQHLSYVVLRVSRIALKSPDMLIDQRAATLLSEIELGKGDQRNVALDFLRETFSTYTTLRKLQRYKDLVAKPSPSPDEIRLRGELQADPEVQKYFGIR